MESPRGLMSFLLSRKAGAIVLAIVLAAFLVYYILGGATCASPAVV